MHRFKNLEIWNLSRRFCSEIYTSTANFPERGKFGIKNQMRRAAISIPSNIAEGASRKSNKDFCRFLEIAIGSCYELETQLLISNDIGFLSDEANGNLIPETKPNNIDDLQIYFIPSNNPIIELSNN